jgi:hypothetical protein
MNALVCFWSALCRVLTIGAVSIVSLIVTLLTLEPSTLRDGIVAGLHVGMDLALVTVLGRYVVEMGQED